MPAPDASDPEIVALRTYVSLHRRWFALAHPDLDYDAIYGAAPASP